MDKKYFYFVLIAFLIFLSSCTSVSENINEVESINTIDFIPFANTLSNQSTILEGQETAVISNGEGESKVLIEDKFEITLQLKDQNDPVFGIITENL